MEFFSGFASSIARDLVCGGVHQLRYPCCFDNLVDDLQREHDKVVQTRNNVQKRIDDARKQTRETAASVHTWLNEANTDIGNVEELLEKARTKKSCCFGQFPNWIWRYRVGKQLAESKTKITECNKEGGNYPPIGRLISLPGLQYFSSERCLMFESRQSAYDHLMKALEGDEVNMIGLYGMGGCGKTTLAIEVGKRAKEDKLFKEVPFVTVSSTVEVTRIQEEIASSLECEFPEKGEMQRAQRLRERLKEEKVLVILDNVWQRLDFEAIGIPSSEIHKGCKVLITTRSEDVCKGMDCQRMIPLSVLTDEEAWDLFQKQARISEATSENLRHLARQISDGCKGLPVAIAAVASTLKGKAEEQWKVALNRLKNSKPVHIEKGLEDPYKCLQLSYDNLDIEEAKSLFLLCSVFPEEYEIPIEDLTRFAIGLGLIGGVHSYEEARNEVCAAKTKLISSCLLLDAADGKGVKMHDLIRQVAHYIAKDEGKGIKCALKKDVTVEYAPRYLWIEEFPCQLDCSNLEFLRISTYGEVFDEIFQGMKKLRVLFLVKRGYARRTPLLTKSFKSLTNLRCLLLKNWELGDISFLVDLKKLESLTLRECSFLGLPDVVVTQLSNLRLLDLSGAEMKRTLFELIGRGSKLEELYIDDCRQEWDLYNERTAEFFSKISIPQSLQRYHIQLGSRFRHYRRKHLNSPKILVISCFDPSNVAVNDLAEEAEVLFIRNIQGGAKNIIPNIFQLDGRGMNELIELWIKDCDDIEHLVDTSNHLSQVGPLFSKLRMLRIEWVVHLRSLYHGLPPGGLFEKLEKLCIDQCRELHGTLFVWKLNLCNLKVLSLDRCSKLTSLFTLAVARSLVQLEELDISDCDELKHIIADDDNKEETSSDDHKLVFPKFKQLTVSDCDKLEYIIPVTYAQGLLQLERLEIVFAPQLKYVFGQCKHGGQLDNHQSQNELKIELPLLEKLTLDNLPNIISMCPENCYLACPSLRLFVLVCPEAAMVSINTCMFGSKEIQCDHNTTEIRKNCLLLGVEAIKNRELTGFFELRGQSIDEEQDSLTMYLEMLSHTYSGLLQSMNLLNPEEMKVNEEFQQGKLLNLHLEYNQLEDFPEITSIPSAPLVNYYSGPFTLCNLKRLILTSCSMLRTLFSPSTAICLTSLEELIINECHELRYLVTYGSTHKKIIQEDYHDSQSHASMLPRLERISVKNCRSLEYIFHESYVQGLVELKDIEIWDTPCLRYVFGHSIHDNNDYVSIFPRMERISVKNCRSLEYIFHVSYVQGLVELKDIEIWEAPCLRYVFGHSIHDNDDAYSSHQYQNKIQIELPVLESIGLRWIPNMINICPDNYYVTCSSLQRIIMDDVGLSTQPVNNLMVHSDHSSASGKEATSMTNGQLIGSVAILNSSKIKGIFHLDELPFDRPHATSWLTDLELDDLPELNYIWKGAKHSVTLQNLKLLDIWGCEKLKIIFSSPVSRSLPQLKILVVRKCKGLEKIIEDDDEEHENASNHQSQKICFLKLKLLLVRDCNKLKRLFYLSTSHEFPELEYLIINQNPHIEQVFEGVRERRVEVLLSKLKHVILVQLPNLFNVSQWIESQTVTNLIVNYCPKLTLTSTTTVEDLLQSYSSHDEEIDSLVGGELYYIRDIMDPEDQTSSGNEDNQIESGAIESHEVLNKGTQLELKLSSHNLTEGIKETETTTTGKVPIPVKPAVPTCDSGQTRESTTSLPTTLHKIPSRKLVDQQTTGEPSFMGQQHELGETIVTAEDAQISIIPLLDGKNVQEGSTSEDATKAALPASTEGNNGFGGVVVTHTEPNGGEMLAQHSQLVKQGNKLNEDEIGTTLCQKINNVDLNLMDKEGEIGVVSNDSIQVPSETAEKVHMPQTTSQFEMDLEDQIASGSDHNQIESGATESHEVLNTGTQDSPSLELKLSSHYSTKSITETETASTRKVPAPVKPTLPIGDSGLPRESKTSLPTTLHKIPSRKLVDQQTTSESSCIDQRHKLGETTVTAEVAKISIIPHHDSIEGIRKENVQEGSTSEDITKAALLASTEGNGFGVVVVTHTKPSDGDTIAQHSQLVEQGDKRNEDETGATPCQKIQNVGDSIQEGSNLMDKEGEMGIVSNDNIEVPLAASAATCGRHSLIIAELGAYKHFVDMDDARIALLVEAIEVYPHLWNVCEKFSKRIQAFMLQILADMLLFLRNESTVSVTPQREKEFYKLCDEAVQLGFERSWVDRMRQRVTIKDPKVDHAREQLTELLKRRDQLSQELHKIEDEINSLNDYIAVQNKCFDFL